MIKGKKKWKRKRKKKKRKDNMKVIKKYSIKRIYDDKR
tara:strand:- start:321 stop:434 length:114 start_codon:yes stop_codon:yes gene_type:complete